MPSATQSSASRPLTFRVKAAAAAGGTLLAALGLYLYLAWLSMPEVIVDVYGRSGNEEGTSVNGTSVLAGMFEQAGHRVRSGRYLSRRTNRFNILVWFPDDFDPPTPAHREFLEDWLGAEPGRTLVYVGRDFDAAAQYWQKSLATAPPAEVREVIQRIAEARAHHDSRRLDTAKEQHVRWFTVRRDLPHVEVRDLRGEWAQSIDVSQTEITLGTRLEVPPRTLTPATGGTTTAATTRPRRNRTKAVTAIPVVGGDESADPNDRTEVLLEANTGSPLVMQVTNPREWGRDGQLLVVTNGSFLLNLPLVNHQHRKLAGRLIAACGEPGTVLFLESGPQGPQVISGVNEPTSGGWEVLTVWPFGAVTFHLGLLGILAGFALYPIFGRPRPLPPEAPSEFTRHARAIGELLARSTDRLYAETKLAHYQSHAKRESGVSHSKGTAETATKPLK